ncbi:electron transfer flavoprotein subunit alpha/FixB family protein [Putridiphycobacter roseus]|uniref:Electron transfer flavoprotein subunit alpha/FixB family protein n=1 Tax=Putridiphycobacter roseus TaxID=2219161 RepID=A0A2W1NN51_9FLAO|nr:electron transfer flavoprotein subunit alpha/FixB family protein [Putridiphycobacter roseus]PZE17112.1 electron transfer flavoprotein subunit alpha/FixB family protein [Putridiphycobacter roseus]
MSVLVYISTPNGHISKSAIEAVYYGSQIGEVTALANGNVSKDDLANLGKYGAKNVLLHASETEDPSQLSKMIQKAATSASADTIILSYDLIGKAIAPRVSAGMKAGYVPGATTLPDANGLIKTNVFSGKAKGLVKVNTPKRIIGLTPNSIPLVEGNDVATVTDFSEEIGNSSITIKEIKKQEGDILLTEADLVVSAGRGLKGPENWGMVEDLAKTLGAATACSRPVADIGWRPHHEHVGQTGIAIRPNLYIAAGISGAIQHLAGVNQSKTIVVINTDPEAPFFKAADYGVIGDAFEVLPALNEAIKNFKANN